MTKEDRQEIVTMLEGGKKYDEIQKHFKAHPDENRRRNVSSATISKYGERAGVIRRARTPARAPEPDPESYTMRETHTSTELINELTPAPKTTKKEAKKATKSDDDSPEWKEYACPVCHTEWRDTERTKACPGCGADLS